MLAQWIFVLLALCHGAELVKVQIDSGWLDGELVSLSFGPGQYYSFKGIPYAEPPVGAMRFKDPVPHKGWKGVRDAKSHGPICTQFHSMFGILTGEEDCLFANVYTPSLDPKKLLPVIVFIHESGWASQSGNDLIHGPDFLVYQGVVLVTFNYRLDILGFLNLDSEQVPGNAAMKDSVVLMRWVQRNIEKFGGDPDQVTIMGESSSGVMVIYHMMSPMTKGLFKRAISMSGVPFIKSCNLAFGIKERSYNLGKILGKNTHNPDELLEFLQSFPAETFLNRSIAVLSQEDLRAKLTLSRNLFLPDKETDFGQERYFTDTPNNLMEKGYMHDVDLLLGYTDNEYLITIPNVESSNEFDLYNRYAELMIPREILMKLPMEDWLPLGEMIKEKYFGDKFITSETMPQLLRHGQDHTFVYNTHRFLRHLPDRDSKTYLYRFELISDRNVFTSFGLKYGIKGAGHGDDITYLFDARLLESVKVDSREFRLINMTTALWTNFAKYGNPTPDPSFGVTWTPYDQETRACMHIRDNLTISNDPDVDIYQWWHQLFVKYGVVLP